MCLQVLDKEVEEDYKDRNYGWKIFRKRIGGLYSAVRGNEVAKDVGVWLDEFDHRYAFIDEFNPYFIRNAVESLQCEGDLESFYPVGWHIYLEKKHAICANVIRHDVVKKVFFRKPLAWGKQDAFGYAVPVVVAKEIMIEE